MSKLIATTYGWVNPEDGKLVTSIRGLSDAINWNPNKDSLEDLNKLLGKAAPKKTQVEESKPVVEDKKVEESKPVVVSKKAAKSKGKKG